MAGHSKWANIKHRKAAQDAKRGKMWTKVIKEITVAVKTGGGPDADANPRLRTALQNARGVNVPKDTIQRAIDKAAGVGGDSYTEVTFEGYGPDGVAVFVECATDNNTRTVANVRSYFNKFNGSLGKDGCLRS
jgi:YebC/PmpR family DNA-binding regulatory protein